MTRASLTLIAILAVGVVAGCGSTSSNAGDSNQSSGNSTQSSPSTTTPKAGTPAKATGRALTMRMGEMFFRPKQVAVSAGRLRITQHNGGQVNHEFILVRSSADPASLDAPGGRVDEAKLKVAGEIPDVTPGQTKSKTFHLKPGKYIFICNVSGHYAAGMYGGLSVK
jgi:uncharacterized cupredoxin-like copper-binding protein